MRIAHTGRTAFAATMIGLGLYELLRWDFAPIWQPVSAHVPARDALIFLCALIPLLSGAGLFWRRTVAPAAGLLFVWLLLWMLCFKITAIVHAPLVEVSYESSGETAVLVAAAWMLATAAVQARNNALSASAQGSRCLQVGRWIFALALIAFGLSHLAYLQETASLVPRWLPCRAAWVGLTGVAYLAAGIAVLAGRCVKWATCLSAWQMAGFTALVWLPAIATGSADAGTWSECVISWTLTVAAWLIAEICNTHSAIRVPL